MRYEDCLKPVLNVLLEGTFQNFDPECKIEQLFRVTHQENLFFGLNFSNLICEKLFLSPSSAPLYGVFLCLPPLLYWGKQIFLFGKYI